MRTIQVSDELLAAAQNFIEVLQGQADAEDLEEEDEEDDEPGELVTDELEEEDEETAAEIFTAMGLLLLQLSTAIIESEDDED